MVRFGVVGTNWITDSLIEASSHHADFELCAVYSRTEEKGRQFADKHGAKSVFTNMEEMAKSDLIDAVYIASPNSFHAEQSILFLENGKHVLCEKPLASNYEEVKRMQQAAIKGNALLMEALKTTLLPNFQVVKDNLPRIGKVRRYFASFCQYSSRYDAYRQGTVLNAFNPEFSNGSLMDLGVYCLYPLVALFGEPKSVKANGVLLESGVDGEGSLLLEYDGFEAVIMHSKITDSSLYSEIQGEDGTIMIEKISTMTNPKIQLRKGEVELLGVEETYPSMYYEMNEFIEIIQTGRRESSVNTYEASLVTMKIIEEARKQIGLVYPADNK